MKSIYLKVTNCCNLACKHCYNSNKKLSYTDINDKNFKYIFDYIKNIAFYEDKIFVIFHGGEPLMIGVEKLITYALKLKYIKNCDINITTNLIYDLSNKHLELFNMCKDSTGKTCISTSWDYKIRFDNKQESIWLNNVKILINNNINVQPIICVTKQLISKYKDPMELFNFFINNKIYALNFERITLTGRATNEIKPTNKEVDDWLFKAYIASKKIKNMFIPIFSILEEACKNQIFYGCRSRQCTKNVITINPDCSISGCPNTSEIIFGDVFGNKNNDIIKSEIQKENFKKTNCYICKYFKYCNGECYQLTFDESGCPGLKSIIKENLKI